MKTHRTRKNSGPRKQPKRKRKYWSTQASEHFGLAKLAANYRASLTRRQTKRLLEYLTHPTLVVTGDPLALKFEVIRLSLLSAETAAEPSTRIDARMRRCIVARVRYLVVEPLVAVAEASSDSTSSRGALARFELFKARTQSVCVAPVTSRRLSRGELAKRCLSGARNAILGIPNAGPTLACISEGQVQLQIANIP